jgi:hypothetical protein
MTFQTDKYTHIKSAISPDMLRYLQIMCDMHERCNLFHTPATEENPFPFGDPQSPNSYAQYGSILSDSLITFFREKFSLITGKNLVEAYSYWRAYYKGAILEKHKDRPSCEYSATVCIKKGNTPWPIYFETLDGREVQIDMDSGDLIVYKGDMLNHWRDPYEGDRHVQIFTHYVDKQGPYKENAYDGRDFLGLSHLHKRELMHN